MKRVLIPTLVLPALVLGLVVVALAADEVLLNDGTEITGEIQSADENGIVIKTGEKTMTIPPAQLDVHNYYQAWKKRLPKDDAKAQLRIGVFAYENGLFNQAKKHYDKAKRIDKAVVADFEANIVPQIAEGVAAKLLQQARAAVDRKDWVAAERIAAKILTQLENTKAAAEARNVLGSVHLWQLNADEERLIKHLTRYLPKDEAGKLREQERILKRMEPINRRMKSARDMVNKGLRTKSQNRAKGVVQQAGKRFDKIVQDLDKLAGEAGDDEALKQYIGEQRKIAVREGVEAYVNAGNVYVQRRAYQDAQRMANAA